MSFPTNQKCDRAAPRKPSHVAFLIDRVMFTMAYHRNRGVAVRSANLRRREQSGGTESLGRGSAACSIGDLP